MTWRHLWMPSAIIGQEEDGSRQGSNGMADAIPASRMLPGCFQDAFRMLSGCSRILGKEIKASGSYQTRLIYSIISRLCSEYIMAIRILWDSLGFSGILWDPPRFSGERERVVLIVCGIEFIDCIISFEFRAVIFYSYSPYDGMNNSGQGFSILSGFPGAEYRTHRQ